ncbi:MAG: hypothetical protein A3F91_11235 [Flavobacteria bacterium RIFCSPLOWO2_12_FULL_35_11]|nr:MAG: hypothetical protein A3F91_11235 [Flavobacteria bacterium RIFCSPLOWO2_12_FULL_35_11]
MNFKELIAETGSITLSRKELDLIFREENYSKSFIKLDDNSEIIIDSSGSFENNYNEIRLLNLERLFTEKLKLYILEETFEYGYENKADTLVKSQMSLNRVVTKEWLNNIYVHNYNNSEYMNGILRLISRFEIDEISPQGPTMAIAAIAHKNEEIQESGIRAFESWSSFNHINILKSIKVESEWLREYLNSVIKNIEAEYAVVS